MEDALNIQIGGSHYKSLPYQPVEFACKVNLNFIQGNIIKYISRYKNKNGKQDLQKVIHYCELGVRLSPNNYVLFSVAKQEAKTFCEKNGFNDFIRDIVEATCYQDWLKVTAKVTQIYEYYG